MGFRFDIQLEDPTSCNSEQNTHNKPAQEEWPTFNNCPAQHTNYRREGFEDVHIRHRSYPVNTAMEL